MTLAPADADALAARLPVLRRLCAVLADTHRLPWPPDALDPDVALFGAGLGLDSIDALELVVAVERAFGVRVAESHEHPALVLRSVNTVVDRLLALGVR